MSFLNCTEVGPLDRWWEFLSGGFFLFLILHCIFASAVYLFVVLGLLDSGGCWAFLLGSPLYGAWVPICTAPFVWGRDWGVLFGPKNWLEFSAVLALVFFWVR